MRRLREIFRIRPAEREKKPRSWVFWVFFFIAVLLALNFALLLPPQLSSLFYEFELVVIQFLRLPLTLPMWLWLIIAVALVIGGYWTVPQLWIPSTREKYIYIRTWVEDNMRFFRTLTGKLIVVHKDLVEFRFKRATVIYPVARIPMWDLVAYESSEMELTEAIILKRKLQSAYDLIAEYEEKLRRLSRYIPLEDIYKLRGVKEEGESK